MITEGSVAIAILITAFTYGFFRPFLHSYREWLAGQARLYP